MKDLSGRVAVVTGGANGIGRALATRFLEEGMSVVLADNDEGDLHRTESDLRALGDVVGVLTDVADASSVNALADTAVDRFGAVHLLCNNAGVGGMQRFATTTLATWEWTLGVNLYGAVYGCHTFLPILAAQEEAHIVNTASIAGFLTGPYLHAYFTSKAAVVALSESLAAEFAIELPHVGVSVLCAAHTSTAIRHDERNAPPGHVRRSVADPDLEPIREALNRDIEAGMPADEVASLVVRSIAERRLHIFTHPELVEQFKDRAAVIIENAHLR